MARIGNDMEPTQSLHETRETLDMHFIALLLIDLVDILFRNFATVAGAIKHFHPKIVQHGCTSGAETTVVVGWVDVPAEG